MKDFEKIREGLLSGDRLSLAKAITLIETTAPEKFEFRNRLISETEQKQGTGFRLSITGVPGSGKSTLIDGLGMLWVEQGHKVAVLAIDPTSSLSNGSILGDKTRMNQLSQQPNAFIRPSPTRLHLGGVASSTFETILLCEAAGYNRIIVETVGVGQSETLASSLTDACLLLLVTGTGDELQGVKKGILESADFILVNKADGENLQGAKQFERELRLISGLWPDRRDGKKAEVMLGSSLTPDRIQALCSQIEGFMESVQGNGAFSAHRMEQKTHWLHHLIQNRLNEKLRSLPDWKEEVERSENAIRNGMGINDAAERVIETFFKELGSSQTEDRKT